MEIKITRMPSGGHYIEVGYAGEMFKLAGIFSEAGAQHEYNRLHKAIVMYKDSIKQNTRKR